MSLKNFLLCTFSLSLSALSFAANADPGSITIPRTVPYVEGAANDAIRAECRFPIELPEMIAEEAKDRGLNVQLTDANIDTAVGRVLSIRTEYVYAQGGGAYTGKKTARIRGELRENGQIIGDFLMERATSRGAGMFDYSACGSLNRISDALGKDVAKWLVRPAMGTRQGIR
ncbi:hypothetical protein [Stenotrophobium rhamnosiphilum]|uniref:hypothetical protein n=1 Tax=Stenotrophobium rhamnosiphilum TaxID=2029166 RepID=UPI0011B1D27C|nr:hypothetical protein [Stenotrophobium rhamnosiphilum]